MLPPQPRHAVWHEVPVEQAGDVLWETAETVAADLIESTERDRLLRLSWHLDPDRLHQLRHLIPEAVLTELRTTLEPGKRAWLQARPGTTAKARSAS